MSEKRYRGNRTTVRFTDEEYRKLKLYSSQCGMTVNDYFVMLLNGYKPKGLMPLDFRKLEIDLRGIKYELRKLLFILAKNNYDTRELHEDFLELSKKLKELEKAIHIEEL